MLGLVWLIFAPERFSFGGVFIVAIWMIPLACQAAHAATLPRDLRNTYAALLQGDYAAASRVLDRILDASPNHWYANYCHAALSLIQGDFKQAARSVSAMQSYRFSTFLAPMFGGHHVDLPQGWVLDSMAKAMEQQHFGSIDWEGADRMRENALQDDEQPAH
jgi:tetratricopeptide (TPR) repeat protein